MKRVTLFLLAAILFCGCEMPDTTFSSVTPLETTLETEHKPLPPETNEANETETTVTKERETNPVKAAKETPKEKGTILKPTWKTKFDFTPVSCEIRRFGENDIHSSGKETLWEDNWLEDDRICAVILNLPEHWSWEENLAAELVEQDDAEVTLPRLEIFPVLYRQEKIPDYWRTARNTDGYFWCMGKDGYSNIHYALPVRVGLTEYWLEMIFQNTPLRVEEKVLFLAYEETYITPILDSLRITATGDGVTRDMPEPNLVSYTFTVACRKREGIDYHPWEEDEPCTEEWDITMDVPDSWEELDKQYSVLYETQDRYERCTWERVTRYYESLPDLGTYTTASGLTCYIKTEMRSKKYTNFKQAQDCQVQHYYIPLDTEEHHWLSLRFITYVTGSDIADPDDYYDTHIQPILDSIQISRKDTHR